MRINQLEISSTELGKFVGCALMGVREHLPEMDLQDLDFRIMVGGHEVDVRQVFSAWEEMNGDHAPAPTPAPTPVAIHPADSEMVLVSRRSLRSIHRQIDSSRDDLFSLDSQVSETYDQIVSRIERLLRNDIRELLVDVVREESVIDPSDNVRDSLASIMGDVSDLLEGETDDDDD